MEIAVRDIRCPFCGEKMKLELSGHDDGSVVARCDRCCVLAGEYDSERDAWYVLGRRSENSDFASCPLCGKPPSVYSSFGAWYAQCRSCHFDITSFESREALKERWNTRKNF